ncbi:MAG: YvcK family protein [Candidatus Sericytochromatia bacterium]|nr:YvcK family protein [Candidatus Tanganyikabacteria bacterium]
MRNLLKWLVPGMGLKRWIFLTTVGVMAQSAGVVALTIAIYRTWRYRSPLDLGLASLGMVLVAIGMWLAVAGGQNIVRSVVRALRPVNAPSLLEALYRNRVKRGPRIVAVGGGTGLASLLRGLKVYSDNITAIVAVSDDGGSSGRLRAELGVLPPGDVRNCLLALAGEEKLMSDLMGYRFSQGGLEGHSFGNLFLTALADLTGDLEQAIRASSRILAVRGQVCPATLASVTLVCRLADGTVVRGESQISSSRTPIAEIWCEPHDPPALPDALRAIREADAIVLGPGSLYTSVIPNLLIPEIASEIKLSRVPRIYVCNVMTQPGETDDYTVADHVRALQKVGGPDLFNYVLVNQDPPQKLLERYQEQGQRPVLADLEVVDALGVVPIVGSLLDEQDAVRHSPAALGQALIDWLVNVRRESTGKLLAFPQEAELAAKRKGWL